MNLIQIRNLSFSYPTKKDTLKNINIDIKEGTFNAIVGENGSGKSTLIKCILGLNKGYSGEIIKEEHIGYLPQKSEIQSNFPATIEEVVLSGTIKNSLHSIFYTKEDKKVTLTGFCTFTSKDKPASTGRNPRTGEPVTIAARTAVSVKIGSKLKEALN